MEMKCPGQSKDRWKPGDIFCAPCPHCGAELEFWKDDLDRTCAKCGKKAKNPRLDLSCAKWCKHARECLGDSEYERIMAEPTKS